MTYQNFFEMTRPELEAHCLGLGLSRVHAKTMYRSAYKQSKDRPWDVEGLPHLLRDNFEMKDSKSTLDISEAHASSYDGSVKFVVKLADGQKIEMVLMPESKRVTLCVSSQVGCAQACVFCHTGRMGLLRNLSTSEIVGQLWKANWWIDQNPEWLKANRLPNMQKVTNIVFMGMGEPLDNVEAVSRAISIWTDPYGANLALRRISVSTAGHLPGLLELIEIHPDVRLAISIHSPKSSERSKIMPINRKWPLPELLNTIRDLPTHKKHGVLLQYTLIGGVNDSIEDAKILLELIQGMKVKINLIPLNHVGPSRFQTPASDSVNAFRDEIYKSGHRVLVRYSKGQDIAAACGQLVVNQKISENINIS